MLLRIGLNAFSRTNEIEADKFAVDHGYGKYFKDAFIRNSSEDCDILFDSQFDTWLNATHPPFLRRIEYLNMNFDLFNSKDNKKDI